MSAEVISNSGGPVLMVLVVGLLPLLVWGAVAAIRGRRSETPEALDPLEILKTRLASGEIDIDEYQRRRDLIVADNVRSMHHE